MSLPGGAELQGLNVAYRGMPFYRIAVLSNFDLTTMDVALKGMPFVQPYGTAPILVVPSGVQPGSGGHVLGRYIAAGGVGIKRPHLP